VLNHDVYALPRPLQPFHRGRVCLARRRRARHDPHLGQGACLALEDAVVLAAELAAGGDPDAAREYRQAIQRGFTELVAEHRAKAAELARLAECQDQPDPPDPGLLAALSQLPLRLAGLPEHLQRDLYNAFQLQVRYHRPRYEVTIRVTIRAEGLDHVVAAITSRQNAVDRSLVVGAPSRIRTCAHGSGDDGWSSRNTARDLR
jgi:site-specific DNA recombinase